MSDTQNEPVVTDTTGENNDHTPDTPGHDENGDGLKAEVTDRPDMPGDVLGL